MMLFQLVDKNKAISKDGIRDGLDNFGPFNGVTGVFHFTPTDHGGLTTESLETYEIRNGQFTKWKP